MKVISNMLFSWEENTIHGDGERASKEENKAWPRSKAFVGDSPLKRLFEKFIPEVRKNPWDNNSSRS
jgi:hypothetical protein